MQVAGSVALVTGGASGLGAATARALIRGGGKVVIADISDAAGTALARELGESALYAAADVADPGAIAGAVDMARRRFGALHVAVCCAGIAPPQRVLGKSGPVSLDWFERTVRVNLIGTFNTVRLAAAAMDANPPAEDGERGVIVMTSSIAAWDGQIGQAAYAASKSGVAGMTLPLARDLARHAIRVMSIAPGLFDTPLLAALPQEARTALGQAIPFPPRLGNPEEFASLVLHILDNRMLNGEVIRLDGALRMGPK